MADETPLSLHTLKPAEGSTKERKRVGRGHGSGNGKTSGRGHKGQKSRSGSHNMRPGFEGGQMPIYMRLGKLRGPNHKKSMPMGPFRTFSWPVNVRDLERFDNGVEVTPELLDQAGLVRNLRHPIKVLGDGTLTKKLTVHAHRFSAKAVEAIEGAGGTVVKIGPQPEQEPAKPKRKAAKPAVEEPAEEQAAAEEERAAEAPAKPKRKPKPAAEEPVAEAEAAAEEPAAEAGAEPAAEEPAGEEPEAEVTDAEADEATESSDD